MKRKILFFIAGPVPTEAERAEASEIVGNVVFRNVKFAADENPEQCDGVAGLVPDNYKRAEEVTADEPEAKPTKRQGRPPKASPAPAAPQTPLIPAESGWKPNA